MPQQKIKLLKDTEEIDEEANVSMGGKYNKKGTNPTQKYQSYTPGNG